MMLKTTLKIEINCCQTQEADNVAVVEFPASDESGSCSLK